MLERTDNSALTQALCPSISPNPVERSTRKVLKRLALCNIGVVLLWGSIVTAGLSSVPNTLGNETKALFFSFCCQEDIWVFMQSRGFTPFCSYDTLHQLPDYVLAKSCKISLWPLIKGFPLSFFVLCVHLSVLAERLVRNCLYQPSRSLPNFRFSQTQWLPLLPLSKESSSGLENPLWVVIPTLRHTSTLSLPFLQSSRNYSFASSSTMLGVGKGFKWLKFAKALYQCYVTTKYCYSCYQYLQRRCIHNQALWRCNKHTVRITFFLTTKKITLHSPTDMDMFHWCYISWRM